jgi:hypothetical protein
MCRERSRPTGNPVRRWRHRGVDRCAAAKPFACLVTGVRQPGPGHCAAGYLPANDLPTSGT